MNVVALPTRRDEAWRWSDLSAALSDAPPPPLVEASLRTSPIIVQLAAAQHSRTEIAVATEQHALRVDRIGGAVFGASALTVEVAAGGALSRIVIQTGDAVALDLVRVQLGEGARFRQFVLALGSKLARIETHVASEGEGAEVELNAVYLAGGGRHVDLTSAVVHEAPNGRTRQLVRGVARNRGRGVFQGKILVAAAAQKTDAEQHHDALLLEEGAEIYAKPELEIYADDVACAHGNTSGALDPRAEFYLRSRGIPVSTARAMLTEAFLREAIPEWLPEDMAAEIDAHLADWLGSGA